MVNFPEWQKRIRGGVLGALLLQLSVEFRLKLREIDTGKESAGSMPMSQHRIIYDVVEQCLFELCRRDHSLSA